MPHHKTHGTIAFCWANLEFEADFTQDGEYYPGNWEEPPEYPNTDVTQVRLAGVDVTVLLDYIPELEEAAYLAIAEESWL